MGLVCAVTHSRYRSDWAIHSHLHWLCPSASILPSTRNNSNHTLVGWNSSSNQKNLQLNKKTKFPSSLQQKEYFFHFPFLFKYIGCKEETVCLCLSFFYSVNKITSSILTLQHNCVLNQVWIITELRLYIGNIQLCTDDNLMFLFSSFNYNYYYRCYNEYG